MNEAEKLANALRRAASPAEGKDWGPEYFVQWKAGHHLALAMLDALANGEDTEPVIQRWLEAAEAEKNITPTSRAERNGARRFSWDPLA